MLNIWYNLTELAWTSEIANSKSNQYCVPTATSSGAQKLMSGSAPSATGMIHITQSQTQARS